MHVLKRMCGYSHYGLKITRMFSTQTNVDYTKDYYAVLGLQRGASDA